MGQMRNYQVIGVASGWGAQLRACEEGPEVLRKRGALEKLRIQKVPIVDWTTLHPSVQYSEKNIPLSESLPLIVDLNRRLAHTVRDALQRERFPVVIGGDHSIAVGTWNGVGDYFAAEGKGPFGLLWIDAHMDAHTPETTPSGAWHGMPLAALLGRGEKQLVELTRKTPILQPQHLCLIGVRSFEEGEAALLNQMNVRVYGIDEVDKRGLDKIVEEAIAHVNQGTVGYGVSIDLDAIDPSDAPGVGSPESNGLKSKELLAILPKLANDERFKAFELVEFNPQRDDKDKTFELCCNILQAVLGKQNG